MQIIKEKIKKTGGNINIKFPLNGSVVNSGDDENMENFITDQKKESINEPVDGDIIRFKLFENMTFGFSFYDGVNHYRSLSVAGFTSEDMDRKTPAVYKSFYMIELFDSYDSNIQNKIYYGILPLNLLSDNSINTTYKTFSNYEISKLYIPAKLVKDFVWNQTLYVRFTFYNSIDGKFHVFYNENNSTKTGGLNQYFEIKAYETWKSFQFVNDTVSCIEFTDDNYVNRLNDTVTSNDTLTPSYPDSSEFGDDGKYA